MSQPKQKALNPSRDVVSSTPLSQQQKQQQQPLLGLDGPITALLKVQVLGLLELLVKILVDFTAQCLSRSGWIASALFFVVVLGFMGLLLVIVFINLDIPENRGPFQDLSFTAYCLGLLHMFF